MITLTREEAQQVLDALVQLNENRNGLCNVLAEIEFLRARLSAPEPEQTRSEKMREAGITRRPKGWSKEDEPEPVAWTVGGLITDFSRDFSAYKTKTYTKPLYTAPPQREWQGLTDEERTYLAWESNNGPHCVAMTEALLKEKNA